MFNRPDGYTIFCDDIRHEVGNKASLMGMYGHEMLVHQPFPTAMPRMGFHIIYREDPGAPQRNMTLLIYVPGDESDKPTYKFEIDRAEEKPLPPDLAPTARRTFAFNVILNPVPLKEAGKIKVRMLVDGEEIRLGTLNVKQGEPTK